MQRVMVLAMALAVVACGSVGRAEPVAMKSSLPAPAATGAASEAAALPVTGPSSAPPVVPSDTAAPAAAAAPAASQAPAPQPRQTGGLAPAVRATAPPSGASTHMPGPGETVQMSPYGVFHITDAQRWLAVGATPMFSVPDATSYAALTHPAGSSITTLGYIDTGSARWYEEGPPSGTGWVQSTHLKPA